MADPLGNLMININNAFSQFIMDMAGEPQKEEVRTKEKSPAKQRPTTTIMNGEYERTPAVLSDTTFSRYATKFW